MADISRKTAQQIVDTVKEICGHNINFINSSGIIIASTDPARIGTFHEGGKKVIRTGEPLEVFENDAFHGTQKGLNLPVLYNGSPAAVIGISGSPEEVRPYARLAERITRLILREQELNAAWQNRNEKKNFLIQSLINGNPADPDYLLCLMDDFRLDPHTPKRIAVIHVLTGNSSNYISTMEPKIRHLCAQIPGCLSCCRYPDDFILLADARAMDSRLEQLRTFAGSENENIHIGIGRSVDIWQADDSFSTAHMALNSLRGTEDSLALFDDLTLDILLGSISADIRREYLTKTITDLTPDDLALLDLYFSQDCSLSKTAEKLFLHKNTLQYRLNHIHQKCGLDPRTFRDAVVLYLAVHLDPGKE